jgi:PAS domain-containing protein
VRDLDFRGLVEGSPDAIAVFDREHRYVYANAALERVWDIPAAEVLGERVDERMPGADGVAWAAAIESVFQIGLPRGLELTRELAAGARHFSVLFLRLGGEHVSAVAHEVTELHADRLLVTAAELEAKRSHEAAHYLASARLLAAEQHARRSAEEARDRTRRLQALTEVLSGAVERRPWPRSWSARAATHWALPPGSPGCCVTRRRSNCQPRSMGVRLDGSINIARFR